jgi:hypothetical protein
MGHIMKMHLGVIDVPYTSESSETTGDVAQDLEDRYGIMQHFITKHEDIVANELESGFANALDMIMKGEKPPSQSALFKNAMGKIEVKFKEFITDKEMDGEVNGVPTKASLEGTSHRFKWENKKRARKKQMKDKPGRPSFVDTGLYRQSFKAWIDG